MIIYNLFQLIMPFSDIVLSCFYGNTDNRFRSVNCHRNGSLWTCTKRTELFTPKRQTEHLISPTVGETSASHHSEIEY